MNDDSLFQRDRHRDLESVSLNQLNHLGNQAIQVGLIIGHGHHGDQYEILRQDEVILLPPQAAATYLTTLIENLHT